VSPSSEKLFLQILFPLILNIEANDVLVLGFIEYMGFGHKSVLDSEAYTGQSEPSLTPHGVLTENDP
jgi:hypothetical protein